MKIKLEVILDLENKTFGVKSDDLKIEHSGSSYLRLVSREKNLYGTAGGWIPEDAFELQKKNDDNMWLHIALGKSANGWVAKEENE